MYRRERTGKGSHVTTSLLAQGAWASGVFLQGALCDGKFSPLGPLRGTGAPRSGPPDGSTGEV